MKVLRNIPSFYQIPLYLSINYKTPFGIYLLKRETKLIANGNLKTLPICKTDPSLPMSEMCKNVLIQPSEQPSRIRPSRSKRDQFLMFSKFLYNNKISCIQLAPPPKIWFSIPIIHQIREKCERVCSTHQCQYFSQCKILKMLCCTAVCSYLSGVQTWPHPISI